MQLETLKSFESFYMNAIDMLTRLNYSEDVQNDPTKQEEVTRKFCLAMRKLIEIKKEIAIKQLELN